MLKKSFRLGRKELGLFYKKKSFFKKGAFIILRFCRNQKGSSRFAFVVSGPKKSAVSRNLARRRMSEIARTQIDGFPKGIDMVFFLKLGQDRKVPKFNELKKDIINAVSSLNL